MGAVGSVLATGAALRNDDYLVSPNGRYIAYMQDDGNLVLYYADNGAVLWDQAYWSAGMNLSDHYSAQPHGGTYFATIQEDGNFVLYNGAPSGAPTPYWASNTFRRGPYWSPHNRGDFVKSDYTAAMQDDGNFVLYYNAALQYPYWSTGTVWASQRVVSGSSEKVLNEQWLMPGDYVHTVWTPAETVDGQVVDPAEEYCAYMQADGNLAVYAGPAGDFSQPQYGLVNTPRYQQYKVGNANAGGPYFAYMQSDNNFVLYNGLNPGHHSSAYWATGTAEQAGAPPLHMWLWRSSLTLWDDGGAVIWPPGTTGN